MATQNLSEPLRYGTIVKVKGTNIDDAIVVENRGLLGPRGARVYGLQRGDEHDPSYFEVLEEQLEVVQEPA